MLTDEPYIIRLPVNIVNTVKETQGEKAKPFTKIGFVEFPSDTYLSDLRVKLMESIPELHRRKTFLFQDAMMADVEPVAEETTKSMYNVSVIIKFASHKGIFEFVSSFSFNIRSGDVRDGNNRMLFIFSVVFSLFVRQGFNTKALYLPINSYPSFGSFAS